MHTKLINARQELLEETRRRVRKALNVLAGIRTPLQTPTIREDVIEGQAYREAILNQEEG